MVHEETPHGVVWVAGVGSRAGLGAAVARRFARGGMTAVVMGRTRERVEAVAAEIRGAGGRAHAFAGDVRREEDVAAIAEKVARFGPLEAAVFNAASGLRAPTALSGIDVEGALRTTTLGGFVFGREAVRRLLPHRRGTLLFTGATASLRGRGPFVAFLAAKAALRSVSQTLAREFGPRGIHVAHLVVDGALDGEPATSRTSKRAAGRSEDASRAVDDIADVYWKLHVEPKSDWAQELDLTPLGVRD